MFGWALLRGNLLVLIASFGSLLGNCVLVGYLSLEACIEVSFEITHVKMLGFVHRIRIDEKYCFFVVRCLYIVCRH